MDGRGDGRLIGYTDGPELCVVCGRCGERVHLFLYMMAGRLNANASCRCPCGKSYYLHGHISTGGRLGDGGSGGPDWKRDP